MFPDLTRDDVFRLETGRLWLRWPRAGDAPAIARLAGEKIVAEMTAGIPHPYPDGTAAAFVLKRRRANAEGAGLALVVTPRAKPMQALGCVTIAPRAIDGRPQLSFWLGRAAWGEGFATEAARALIDAFFAYTEGRELLSSPRVVNPAARRVVEKCGFAYLGSGLQPGPARGGVISVDEFRLDRRAWESLKSWSRLGYVPVRAAGEREAMGA